MANITFNNPTYLWYLFAVPLIIFLHFWFLRRAKKKAVKFANFEAMKRATGKGLMTKNLPILVIRVFVIILAILAVSGTTFWYNGLSNEADFVIAIDASASMSAKDIEPSRLEAAKERAVDFVNSLDSRAGIGVVRFSGVVFIEQQVTEDRGRALEALQGIELVKAGGTDISGSIVTSTNLLINSEKGRSMLLITDGSETTSPFVDESIRNAVAYARENQVIIHAIGVGSVGGPIGYLPEYYNISTTYNSENLRYISNQTEGVFAEAVNEGELEAAFNEISQNSEEALLPVDLSFTFMLIALLLIFLEWVLINTRFKRIL